MTPAPEHSFDGLDVVAFAAELVVWAACGVAAFRIAGGGAGGWVVGVILVLLVIAAWSLVMAPRAPGRLPVRGRQAVVLCLGAAAAALLLQQTLVGWALATGVASVALVLVDGRRRSSR